MQVASVGSRAGCRKLGLSIHSSFNLHDEVSFGEALEKKRQHIIMNTTKQNTPIRHLLVCFV